MIPFSIIFLTLGCLEASASDTQAPSSIVRILELQPASAKELDERIGIIFKRASEKAVYLGSGALLGSASLLAGLSWGATLVIPGASTIGNECLLLSHVMGITAQHAFAEAFKEAPSLPPFLKGIPVSLSSWHLNQKFLSQIPAISTEEKQLVDFLQRRWLAKSTGFYPGVVDWLCPCFGISIQMHPESTNSYARDPSNKCSLTYINRVENWKQSLPQPRHFPLILTRPHDPRDYLPSWIGVSENELPETTAERSAQKMQSADSKIIIDLTGIFSESEWLKKWNSYQAKFAQACKERKVHPDRVICIQRVAQKDIGGIRILPLADQAENTIESDYLYLLELISKFGLSANRVELDRWEIPSILKRDNPPLSLEFQPKEEFLSSVQFFSQNWKSTNPQKNLMFKGTIAVIEGLFTNISEEKWEETLKLPTQSAIVHLSFSKIIEELKLLAQDNDAVPFYETAAHIEQVHSHLSALLEIFAPFSFGDFPGIYGNLLRFIPQKLKPMTSYALHTSGMTSLAGIFKAVEKAVDRRPRVLYGENTYFENIYTAERVSHATAIDEATEKDWEEVDLLLVQFNPVLKRIDFEVTDYKAEKIAENLHRCLKARRDKPVILALDCTLDYIDSPRVGNLLTEFQDEIEKGTLNIICYRSGLKFDLFGMDNYCGAPLYMIHNSDQKWAIFDSVLNDPLLITEHLSLNWFCLAFQNAAPQLELYRKQVFENTRALLDKVPARMYKKNADYRIIPISHDADPAFIDIKISGPFHEMKSGLLVGALLSIKCMQEGHPVFYRPSLGFYHPNFSMLFSKDCSTIRLTLGLDPSQVDIMAKCFEMIDALNGSPWQLLHDKMRVP